MTMWHDWWIIDWAYLSYLDMQGRTKIYIGLCLHVCMALFFLFFWGGEGEVEIVLYYLMGGLSMHKVSPHNYESNWWRSEWEERYTGIKQAMSQRKPYRNSFSKVCKWTPQGHLQDNLPPSTLLLMPVWCFARANLSCPRVGSWTVFWTFGRESGNV